MAGGRRSCRWITGASWRGVSLGSRTTHWSIDGSFGSRTTHWFVDGSFGTQAFREGPGYLRRVGACREPPNGCAVSRHRHPAGRVVFRGGLRCNLVGAVMRNGCWRFLWRGGTASCRANLGFLSLALMALIVPRVLSLTGQPGAIAADLVLSVALLAVSRRRLAPRRRRPSSVRIDLVLGNGLVGSKLTRAFWHLGSHDVTVVVGVALVFTRLALGGQRSIRVRRRDDRPFIRHGPRVRNGRGLGGTGLRLRIGGRLIACGSSGWMVLVGGSHSHVPPDGVWWVGPPDGVESRFGWVLPGCGIAVRPLPRLIHRRRFTALC